MKKAIIEAKLSSPTTGEHNFCIRCHFRQWDMFISLLSDVRSLSLNPSSTLYIYLLVLDMLTSVSICNFAKQSTLLDANVQVFLHNRQKVEKVYSELSSIKYVLYPDESSHGSVQRFGWNMPNISRLHPGIFCETVVEWA